MSGHMASLGTPHLLRSYTDFRAVTTLRRHILPKTVTYSSRFLILNILYFTHSLRGSSTTKFVRRIPKWAWSGSRDQISNFASVNYGRRLLFLLFRQSIQILHRALRRRSVTKFSLYKMAHKSACCGGHVTKFVILSL